MAIQGEKREISECFSSARGVQGGTGEYEGSARGVQGGTGEHEESTGKCEGVQESLRGVRIQKSRFPPFI